MRCRKLAQLRAAALMEQMRAAAFLRLWHSLDGSGFVDFIVRYKINEYAISVPEPTVFQWNLFTATFTNGEFAMFINGCNWESYCTKSDGPRDDDYSQNTTFHMGDAPWHSLPGYTPHVAIDELMICYRVLTADDACGVSMYRVGECNAHKIRQDTFYHPVTVNINSTLHIDNITRSSPSIQQAYTTVQSQVSLFNRLRV